MPDLATELSHLEEANKHVAVAREQLSIVETLDLPLGASKSHGDRLKTLRKTLEEFEAHRKQIVKTIEGIRDPKRLEPQRACLIHRHRWLLA